MEETVCADFSLNQHNGQELRHILSSENILNDRVLFLLYQERKGTEYEGKTAGTIQNREDFSLRDHSRRNDFLYI